MKMIRSLYFLHTRQFAGLVHFKRNCSSSLVPKTELTAKKNAIFIEEQKRQLEEVGRIEKITVNVSGPLENVSLIMNKDISTPYDCCRHISQGLCQQAALALVDNTDLWDMHRPLSGSCSLKFLTFKDKEPYYLNKAFWRTGSFLLGAVISRAFKDEFTVHLHSFPPPYLRSGSFIYDTYLDLDDWQPSEDELRILSAEFIIFVQQNLKIERLRVKKSVAVDIFEDNPFKLSHAKSIAASAQDHSVTLYKVGDHIDISNGPMVGNTSFFGRCTVTCVHRIETPEGILFRFQGVALPKGILLNSFAYDIIVQRGTKLNEADLPGVTNDKYGIYKNKNLDKNSLTDVPNNIFGHKFTI